MSIIEELFSLFRENQLLRNLIKNMRLSQDIRVELRGNENLRASDINPDDFLFGTTDQYLKSTSGLLHQLNTLKDLTLRESESFICYACSKETSPFFNILPGTGLMVTLNQNICQSKFLQEKVKLKIAIFVTKYAMPFAGLSLKNMGKNLDPEYSIKPIDIQALNSWSKKIERCFQTPLSSYCRKICSELNYFEFSFPVNIIESSKQINKIMYESLTNRSYDLYLEETKRQETFQ